MHSINQYTCKFDAFDHKKFEKDNLFFMCPSHVKK
jgi:hypothetical protein